MTKLSSSLSYKLLRQWDHLLRTCSSVTPLKPRWEIWSDASGKGYGGHLGPQTKPIDVWQDKHNYSTSKGKGSTEFIEAKALLLSLQKWSDTLKGKTVWCYIDNYQVYQTLTRKYSPKSTFSTRNKLYFTSNLTNPLFLSSPLFTTALQISSTSEVNQPREKPIKCPNVKQTFDEIDALIKEYQITIKARWVWGKDNFLADKLSRLGNGNGKGTLTPHVINLLNSASESPKKASEDIELINDNDARVA